jgi:hypothetical protein
VIAPFDATIQTDTVVVTTSVTSDDNDLFNIRDLARHTTSGDVHSDLTIRRNLTTGYGFLQTVNQLLNSHIISYLNHLKRTATKDIMIVVNPPHAAPGIRWSAPNYGREKAAPIRERLFRDAQ